MNVKEMVEDVAIAMGLYVSIIDIQQILSIVLLVFNIIWICVKAGINIRKHIKEKKYDEIDDDIKDAIDEIEDLSKKDKNDSADGK